MRKLLVWLTNTKAWFWLLMNVLPYLRTSVYYTRFSGKSHALGYRYLQPGRFILTVDEQKVTSFLVPGFMTHAGFCVDKVREWDIRNYMPRFEVAEMTHKHFTESWFFDVCKESSRVLICDCIDWDDDDRRKMVNAVMGFKAAKYDVQFDLGVQALYCSELVYQADQAVNKKLLVDLSDVHGLGRKYISPDGLLFGRNVRVIWDSDGQLDGLMGPEVKSHLIMSGVIKR